METDERVRCKRGKVKEGRVVIDERDGDEVGVSSGKAELGSIFCSGRRSR